MKEKVLQLRRADTAAQRPYDNALIPSVSLSGKVLQGLNWKFFTGDYPWVISEKGMKMQQQSTSHKINGTEGPNKTGIILYEGYIKVPADGQYDFNLTTSSKAFIRLHEACLFDADFGYKLGTALTQQLFLKAGYHPVKIYLLKKKNEKRNIRFQWRKTGEGEWKMIGEKDLYQAVKKIK